MSARKETHLARANLISFAKADSLKWDSTVLVLYSTTFALVGLGVLMVLSASSVTSYLANQGFFGAGVRHAGYALVGTAALILASRTRLQTYRRLAFTLYILGILLQLLVFTPLGAEVGANRNWLRIGGISVQPSEFLKLAVIVLLATLLGRTQKRAQNIVQELAPIAVFGGFAIVLVMAGRDLGTASVFGLAALGCMLFGQISWKSLAATIGAALFAVSALILTSENRRARFFSFGSSEVDYSGLDWQPLHGMWAVANGGVFGNGIGSSKAKWSWLPAADNDYIFAIIGEELGLVGCVAVLLTYLLLAWAMLKVIKESRDIFGKVAVGGVFAWIIGQALVNIAVVLKLFPVLGVPLPLVSAGGTALLACMLAMGVVIAVAHDNAAYKQELQAQA